MELYPLLLPQIYFNTNLQFQALPSCRNTLVAVKLAVKLVVLPQAVFLTYQNISLTCPDRRCFLVCPVTRFLQRPAMPRRHHTTRPQHLITTSMTFHFPPLVFHHTKLQRFLALLTTTLTAVHATYHHLLRRVTELVQPHRRVTHDPRHLCCTRRPFWPRPHRRIWQPC